MTQIDPSPSPEALEEREAQARQRRIWRIVASVGFIGLGLLLVFYFREWEVEGVWAPYIGYGLIALGALGLLGVNVFWAGPLDKRRD